MSTGHTQTPSIVQAGILPSWAFRDESLTSQCFYSVEFRLVFGLVRALFWRKKFVIISFYLKKGFSGFILELFYYRLVRRNRVKKVSRQRQRRFAREKKLVLISFFRRPLKSSQRYFIKSCLNRFSTRLISPPAVSDSSVFLRNLPFLLGCTRFLRKRRSSDFPHFGAHGFVWSGSRSRRLKLLLKIYMRKRFLGAVQKGFGFRRSLSRVWLFLFKRLRPRFNVQRSFNKKLLHPRKKALKNIKQSARVFKPSRRVLYIRNARRSILKFAKSLLRLKTKRFNKPRFRLFTMKYMRAGFRRRRPSRYKRKKFRRHAYKFFFYRRKIRNKKIFLAKAAAWSSHKLFNCEHFVQVSNFNRLYSGFRHFMLPRGRKSTPFYTRGLFASRENPWFCFTKPQEGLVVQGGFFYSKSVVRRAQLSSKFLRYLRSVGKHYYSPIVLPQIRLVLAKYWKKIYIYRRQFRQKLRTSRPFIFAYLRPALEGALGLRFEVFKVKNIFSIPLLTKQFLVEYLRGRTLSKFSLDVDLRPVYSIRRMFKAFSDVRYFRYRFLRFYMDVFPVFYFSLLLRNLVPFGFLIKRLLVSNQRSHFKVFKFLQVLVRVEMQYLSFACDSFKLQLTGRVQGKPRTQQKVWKFGVLAPQTLSHRIFYYSAPVVVKYGVIGIRMWLTSVPRWKAFLRY